MALEVRGLRDLVRRLAGRGRTRAPARCANCGISIEGDDLVESGGRTYCCDGCSDGGPCTC